MFSDFNARIFQPPKVVNSFFLFSVVRLILFSLKISCNHAKLIKNREYCSNSNTDNSKMKHTPV